MPFLLTSKSNGFILIQPTYHKIVHISEDIHLTYYTFQESSPVFNFVMYEYK